jgi:hypothetical protein
VLDSKWNAIVWSQNASRIGENRLKLLHKLVKKGGLQVKEVDGNGLIIEFL